MILQATGQGFVAPAGRASRALVAVAIAGLLAACSESDAATCGQVTEAVTIGAQCTIVDSGMAEYTPLVNAADVPAADCPRHMRTFRSMGLTTHDAAMIVKDGLDDFYSTYKSHSFCEIAHIKIIAMR